MCRSRSQSRAWLSETVLPRTRNTLRGSGTCRANASTSQRASPRNEPHTSSTTIEISGLRLRQVGARTRFENTLDAAAVAKTLRANGIVGVEPYRGSAATSYVAMLPAEDALGRTAYLEHVVSATS